MKKFYLSEKSLNMMKGVHENVVNFMKELISISPYDFKITSGVRTAEEQNKLYQQGRTKPGAKVTGADGYKRKSNHQMKEDGFGHAVDIAVLVEEDGKIVYKGGAKDAHYYKAIYDKAKESGLLEKYKIQWAGNWRHNTEGAHFQYVRSI